jgi:hypothetical protein
MNAVLKETAKKAARRIAQGMVRGRFTVVALHEYRTADGTPIYWRIRCRLADGSKWIRPMHRKGVGYVAGEPPAPAEGKPLYGLDWSAANPNAPIFIVEGEKAADALHKLGIVAMTSGGCCSADAADWRPLHGRRVIVWPDNDEPGAKYAHTVIAKLDDARLLAREVVEALPEHGDAFEWLAEHPDATAADVIALSTSERTPRWDGAPNVELIDGALLKAVTDPGAIYERNVLNAIRAVRASDPAQYQRIRAAAKKAGCVIGELDRLTIAEPDAGEDDVFTEVELWSDPVDGAALLTEISEVLHRHVVADTSTITAAALWAMHTWCMDVLTVSPLAHIQAPEKRCGKTVLLTALSRLVSRPLPVSNISSAALFRSMELWRPTLLADEVDSFLRDNEEARGVINSGIYRETAFVLRCDGDDHTPTKFATWGAKALCGIGKLADTIEDRSIPLRLRRKVPGEHAENIRRSDPAVWHNLRSRIARWTTDNLSDIGIARPEPAPGLNDRAQDCWEPLLAIADLAAGEWPDRARSAAIALHGVENESPSIGVELLADIKGVFENKRATRLASRDLLAALVEDDESPWAAWNRGKPLSVRQLAARLKDFGVSPKTMRLRNGERLKGYLRESFTDAFSRYVSEDGSTESDAVTTTSERGSQGIAKRDASERVTGKKPLNTASNVDCHGDTDDSAPLGRKGRAGGKRSDTPKEHV